MAENVNIKEELFSLYKIIKNKISNAKTEKDDEDINSINSSSLLNYIKENIQILINQNIYIELKNNYNQLEKYIIKLEMDNKYYLKYFMRYKIQKDALEMKLNAYMGLEDEFEELKEKVKYEGGKFLENDRKDNEIIILRRENSTLKKEIANLENKNKKYENKNAIYKNNIKELQKEIQSLNKKISDLEKSLKENKIKNNLQKNLTNCNSCSNLNNENILEKMDNNNINGNYNYSLKNIRNLYNNNNNKNLLNTLNTNNFVSTFSKKANGINYKKIKIPIKNEFTFIKESRNNSISVIHKQKDESKINLANRKFINKIEKYPNLIKPENKTRNIKEFLNLKPPNFYPLTSKNDINLIPKYIQREFNNNSHNLN